MADKQQQIDDFDPENPGVAGNIFGLPFTSETAKVILMPVPWDVTVSYREGTSKGPSAILEASAQLDYYLPDHPDGWMHGIYMLPMQDEWQHINQQLRPRAASYIEAVENGQPVLDFEATVKEINQQCHRLKESLYLTCKSFLEQDKIAGVVGGDHSTPLGLIKALDERYDTFGILQIDAHADLRKSYEAFTYSHASIMYNVLQETTVNHIVQVGVRDVSRGEIAFAQQNSDRVTMFHDMHICEGRFGGKTWKEQSQDIISALPEHVYISFDIDGLQPALCPDTGTPVPGGLSFEEAVYLIRSLLQTGKKIIGFDLCEVAPGASEWNAIVGARVLYHLCVMAAASHVSD